MSDSAIYRCEHCFEPLAEEAQGEECPRCGSNVKDIEKMGYEIGDKYHLGCEECDKTFSSERRFWIGLKLIFHQWTSHTSKAREEWLG